MSDKAASPVSCDRHFEVVSPEIFHYSFFAPTESHRAWAMVEATTKRSALVAAVRLPEFAEWVSEKRGDGVPPFKGLEAQRPYCEHGVCWGCDNECIDCISTIDCPESR